MQLRVTPRIGARYWAVILLASMCGTNLGDFFPDVLKLGTLPALAILALLFAAIIATDSLIQSSGEASYWACILVVRGAATSIADAAISEVRLGYVEAAAMAGLLLGLLIALRGRAGAQCADGRAPASQWFVLADHADSRSARHADRRRDRPFSRFSAGRRTSVSRAGDGGVGADPRS